jgi:hypothetical protein
MSESAAASVELKEWLAQIDRAQEETRKFAQEQHKLVQEALKLGAEAAKLNQDRGSAPLQMVVTAVGAGAALFVAGAAFTKLFMSH